MRNSDTSCEGTCEKHGKWVVLVEFASENCCVPDECPVCQTEYLLNASDERADKAHEEGWNGAESEARISKAKKS